MAISEKDLEARRLEVEGKIKDLERREATAEAEIARLCGVLGLNPEELTDELIRRRIASAEAELQRSEENLTRLDSELVEWDKQWQSFLAQYNGSDAGAVAPAVVSQPAPSASTAPVAPIVSQPMSVAVPGTTQSAVSGIFVDDNF